MTETITLPDGRRAIADHETLIALHEMQDCVDRILAKVDPAAAGS